MITPLAVFYKQKNTIFADKNMNKMHPIPYKKGIHSTLLAADAFVLQIFSQTA